MQGRRLGIVGTDVSHFPCIASSAMPAIWPAGGSEADRVLVAKVGALRDNAERWKNVSISFDVAD
jgi:hypothetical protein